MKKLILFFLFQISFFTNAQNALVSETIQNIDYKEDTIKAVFDWITDNIRYDVAKFNRIKESGSKMKVPSPDERLNYVLENKKGVCQHYSELFQAILQELGYEVHVVSGYAKKEDEKTKKRSTISHAWSAVKVNGEWKLYDATWASGGLRDGKRFVKMYKPEWYDVDPKEMIKTHIPFDPIWQLLDYPINFKSFDSNKLTSKITQKYDFEKKINAYLELDDQDQMMSEITRCRELGEGGKLVERWLVTRVFNEANYKIKEATAIYNEYVAYRRTREASEKWTPSFTRKSLEKALKLANEGLESLGTIKTKDENRKAALKGNIANTTKLTQMIKDQLNSIKG